MKIELNQSIKNISIYYYSHDNRNKEKYNNYNIYIKDYDKFIQMKFYSEKDDKFIPFSLSLDEIKYLFEMRYFTFINHPHKLYINKNKDLDLKYYKYSFKIYKRKNNNFDILKNTEYFKRKEKEYKERKEND